MKGKWFMSGQLLSDTPELTQYAVQTRYPGEWEPVTFDEANQAMDRAALVLNWVEEQITH